ncbi:hypothetical protein EYF80_010132 [Liparis tanakae]|uniref:Uncharacterized protein n=1 Tax=Liparis tanakae TaxID=230148 RepID=A0A4Z2INC0_9TELE|nr:hypothetical protein EYF80_010132 [Liparis tanakae]
MLLVLGTLAAQRGKELSTCHSRDIQNWAASLGTCPGKLLHNNNTRNWFGSKAAEHAHASSSNNGSLPSL